MMRKLLAATALSALLAHPAWSEAMNFPLTDGEGLIDAGATAAPASHKGQDGVRLTVDPTAKNVEDGGCDNCTFALIDGVDFGDGEIEVSLSGERSAGSPPESRGFVGIVFRASADGKSAEGIYFRPHNTLEPTQERRNRTMQYFSLPDHPWHRLREESPGKYETFAPVLPGEWSRLRVVVKGARAEVFVDTIAVPILVVDDLKLGADARGTVGLFTEPGQDAFFRDLVIRPAG